MRQPVFIFSTVKNLLIGYNFKYYSKSYDWKSSNTDC